VQKTIYPDDGMRVETHYKDGSLLSITGTAVFPMRYTNGVESDGGIYRSYAKEIKLDATGSDTGEWTKTYTDGAGRAYKTVYASASGTPAAISYFNNKASLPIRSIRWCGHPLPYNGRGELAYTAVT